MGAFKTYQPSESELEILQVIWAYESVTVRFVHEQISKKRDVGYTTILKQMQRLTTEKKILERYKEGKVHYYRAIPQESEIQQSLIKRLLNPYRGSAMDLVMHLLGQNKTTPEELAQLQKWLEEQKKNKDE